MIRRRLNPIMMGKPSQGPRRRFVLGFGERLSTLGRSNVALSGDLWPVAKLNKDHFTQRLISASSPCVERLLAFQQ